MMGENEEKGKVLEKRVKPTVIRRRKEEPPSAAETKETAAADAFPATEQRTAPAVSGAPVRPRPEKITAGGPIPPAATATPAAAEEKPLPFKPVPGSDRGKEKAGEEKAKKGVRRRKSRAELDLEDIQRAGGLKQYALQTGEETSEPEEIAAVIPEETPEAPETPAKKTVPTKAAETPWEGPTIERVFEPTLAQGRRKRVLRREFKKTAITETKASKKIIRFEKEISISELSQKMGVKLGELVRKLMDLGVMATANQRLDVDTASLVVQDYGFEVESVAFKEEEVLTTRGETAAEGAELSPRAPVVTIMGHVDHGKTSILDTIRKTKVAEGEAGGITQHIGAYEVFLPKGSITFIDTPGHAAFTRMRARGAKVTDIVVLVVAADDGIMPQTVEAIHHAKSAQVPIIAAINKIDKPGADPEKVKRQLSEQGLVPEDWGGDVICVPTSAKSGAGIVQLLEMILLAAEMKELKGAFKGPAKGIIIESRLEKGRGAVATVLIQSGTLRLGDYAVCGQSFGRVRAMIQADGKNVKEAVPSKPVEILGLDSAPPVGDELFAIESERDARKIIESRETRERERKAAAMMPKRSLDILQEKIRTGESHELPLVIKADVIGSAEALVDAIQKLGSEKVKPNVLHWGTGGITENDVVLAQASGALVIGFNVSAESKARQLAEQEKIEIRRHSIIYEVLEEIRKAMEGLLAPEISEKYAGRARVKQVFKISKVGMIAGCGVTDGVIRRKCRVRLTRDGVIVFEGKIASLKHLKEDVREVQSGMECGIGLENFNDVKAGDEIEAFEMEEKKQTLP